jgi:uncharacterized Zn finger protein (UPF0148 family)
MAMVKRGISFQNSIVEVLDGGDSTCEGCGKPINMMSSTNGVVTCSKCGHKNKVKNMENEQE